MNRYELAVTSIVHWDVDFFGLIRIRLTVLGWLCLVNLMLVTVVIVLLCLQLLLVLVMLLLLN